MDKVKKFCEKIIVPSKITKGIIISMLFSLVVSAIAAKCFRFVLLNDNQLLYLFSAMAQVIAGLLGLTLTSYTFFVGKFQQDADDKLQQDDSEYEAAKSLTRQYYGMIISISVVCGVTILACVLGIIFLSRGFFNGYAFIIDVSVCLFCVGFVSILFFGISILDPDKITKELAHEVLKFGIRYGSYDDSFKNMGVFLTHYISLEKIITEFATEIMKRFPASNRYKPYDEKPIKKPMILQSMDVLVRSEQISPDERAEINNLRKVRNALVHELDVHVSDKQCKLIAGIYGELKDRYSAYLERTA